MARKTVYVCDHCGGKISDQCGPIRVSVSAEAMPEIGGAAELCGVNCARDWVAGKANNFFAAW